MERARDAQPDDLPALADMAADAVAEQCDARGGWVWSRREARALPLERSLQAAIENPEAIVVIGDLDDAPVGYAVAHLELLRTGEPLAVVEDIYVHPDGRGVGLGEAMMDRVVAWATEHDCVGIDAFVLPGNRQSKNFFETFGLTARAILVHRRLRDD
ncbi:MAG: GNAT family N-acetyltransferase [Acidimicrobiia bacterium]|nr:GNAT family N-acetyltransferase [Acidimicrobiia bacterium]